MHKNILKTCLWLLVICPALALSRQQYAAVAMPDNYSAAATSKVLEEGGNAVDAAVTAAFVLAVTWPEAGNIGGGGFMVSHIDERAEFLDFRETAPIKAHRDMYLDEDGNVIPGLSFTGPMSIGVPGTVRGMAEAHARYGTLPWARLLQPAIELAAQGFIVHANLAAAIESSQSRLAGPTNFARYFPPMKPGERFKQPDLAKTLRRLAVNPDDFYLGETAQLLVAQMRRDGGLISAEDLERYRPVWRKPLVFNWRGYDVYSTAPPSSGGIALAQLLGMYEEVIPRFASVGHNSAAYVHLMAEIEKRVFADRGKYLGDPDFHENPVAALIDPAYLEERARGISTRLMTPPENVLPGLESTDTTHFSILDFDGNAVSVTYTLNWDFGSGVVVEGGGFLLNDEMDDFSAAPGVPNQFGVIGDELNAIEPGKRMLSSMSPTVVAHEGEVVAVLGTPGGSTIFTSVFQVLLNTFEFGMSAQQAVDSLRFHHQLPQGRLIRHDGERKLPEGLVHELERYGYTVEPNAWGDIGDVQLIVKRGDGLQAASDSRGRGESRVLRAP